MNDELVNNKIFLFVLDREKSRSTFNNANKIISKIINGDTFEEDNIYGAFQIWVHTAPVNSIERVLNFDGNGFAFLIRQFDDKFIEYYVKRTDFSPVSELKEFYNIKKEDLSINSKLGIDYLVQPNNRNTESAQKNRIYFVFLVKQIDPNSGKHVYRTFDEALWTYYGLRKDRVLPFGEKLDELKVKEDGGNEEYVFSLKPFERDDKNFPYWYLEEMSRMIVNSDAIPSAYYFKITDDDFSPHDFTNLLALTKQTKTRDKLFIINFAFDYQKMFKLRPLLAFLNDDKSNNIIFLINDNLLINSNEQNAGVTSPIIRFQNDDYCSLLGRKVEAFSPKQSTRVEKLCSKNGGIYCVDLFFGMSLQEYYFNRKDFSNKNKGGKTAWIRQELLDNCVYSHDVKLNDLLSKFKILDWAIIANLIDVFDSDKIDFETLNEVRSRLIDARIIDIYVISLLLKAIYEEDDISDIKSKDEIMTILDSAFIYADGIYELIENACRHTNVHEGYLWIRLNRTAVIESRKSDDEKQVDCAEKRLELNSFYCNRNNKRTRINARENRVIADYSHYIELSVFDFSEVSLSETFFKTNEIKVEDLSEFFLSTKRTEKHSAHCAMPENIVHHYGLHSFYRSVINNGGIFTLKSVSKEDLILNRVRRVRVRRGVDGVEQRWMGRTVPYNKELELRTSREFHSQQNEYLINQTYRQMFPGTVYNIIIPVGYVSKEKSDSYEHSNLLFDISSMDKQYSFVDVVIDNNNKHFNQTIDSAREKMDIVNSMGQFLLKSLMMHQKENEDDTIYQITLNELYEKDSIEIFTKGLMYTLLQHSANSRNGLKYAILFRSSEEQSIAAVKYFANYISLFFVNLSSAQSERINKIQIAVCSNQNNLPIVNFVLTGSNADTMYYTAKHYAYYNFSYSRRFLSLLKLVLKPSPDDSKSITVPPLFPFDLHLYIEGKCWFINAIEEQLGREIRVLDDRESTGGRISNIHFKVSDAVHIENFYTVDLLLNNMSNIYRFAFLCGRAIIAEIKRLTQCPNSLLIVGHREYTSILIQQIIEEMNVYFNRSIKLSGGYIGFDNKGEEEFVPMNQDIIQDEENVIIITPIGITFASFEHMLKAIKKYKATKKIGNEHIIMIQRQCLFITEYGQINNDSGSKYLRDDIGNNIYFDGLNYYYFIGKVLNSVIQLKPNTDCHDCYPTDATTEKLLVSVNSATSKPNKIFPLLLSENLFQTNIAALKNEQLSNISFSEFESLLAGCMRYAHIKRNENHYQFYIDTKLLFANLKRLDMQKKYLTNWVIRIRSKLFTRAEEPYSFNILVSPEHESNSAFIKFIAENVFNHNIKFVHFPIENTYREDVRAQLSYISKDIRYINDTFPAARLNVFFVDDTIISGKSYNLLKSRMEMLIREALEEISPSDRKLTISLFDGVFILLNRLSPDTIKTMMGEPIVCTNGSKLNSQLGNIADIEDRFFSFLDLPVPSFKTKHFDCPSCTLSTMFEENEKRAATNAIAISWLKKKQKNALLTIKEYDDKLSVEKRQRRESDGIRRLYSLLRAYSWVGCKHSEHLAQLNLQEIKFSGESGFEFGQKQAKVIETMYALTKNDILEFFSSFMWEKISKKLSQTDKIEWFISNIKAFSRPLLSTYHHVGQAVLTILLEIVEGIFIAEGLKKTTEKKAQSCERTIKIIDLLTKIEATSSIKKIAKNEVLHSINVAQCHAFLSLLKQLAGLGSAYLLRKDTVLNSHQYWRKIIESIGIKDVEIEVKTEDDFIQYYIGLIKLSMSERDDSFDEYAINKWVLPTIESFIIHETKGLNASFFEALYIENSQSLYKQATADVNSDVHPLFELCYKNTKKFNDFCEEITKYISGLKLENGTYYVNKSMLFSFRPLDADGKKEFAFELGRLQAFTTSEGIDLAALADEVFDIGLTKKWVLDTFHIGEAKSCNLHENTKNQNSLHAIIRIAFDSILGTNIENNQPKYLYLYLHFATGINRLEALQVIRKILFLRHDISNELERLKPAIWEPLTRPQKEKWLIIKELFDRISNKENGHYSLLTADGDFSKCILALQYAQRLFNELNLIDFSFVDLQKEFEANKQKIILAKDAGNEALRRTADEISKELAIKLSIYCSTINQIREGITNCVKSLWVTPPKITFSFSHESESILNVKTFSEDYVYWTESFNQELSSILLDIRKYGKGAKINVEFIRHKEKCIDIVVRNIPVECDDSLPILCGTACNKCAKYCEKKNQKKNRPTIVEMTEFINATSVSGERIANPSFGYSKCVFISTIYTILMRMTW